MKAVIWEGPNKIRVGEMPIPQPRPGQMLVRVAACGICGSDLRYYAGENPWALHTLGYPRPNPKGMILGHEIGGYVDVTGHGDWQRVGVLSFKACGMCAECRRGVPQLCAHTAHLGHGAGWQGQNAGGMAEFCPVWRENIYFLADMIDVEEATFLDGLAVAVHAVRTANIPPMSSIVVMGGGPIGLLIAQTARALGAGRILVTDIYDTPLECARELNIEALKIAAPPDKSTSQEIQGQISNPILAIFDTTGDAAVQKAALKLLSPGGKLVLLAGVGQGLRLSLRDLAGERHIMTSSNHQYEDFTFALELLAQRRVHVKPMITHRFPLEEAPRAFAIASDKMRTGALKVLLIMEE